jgi:hypothetical protein
MHLRTRQREQSAGTERIAEEYIYLPYYMDLTGFDFKYYRKT